jgi:hypothetical protein
VRPGLVEVIEASSRLGNAHAAMNVLQRLSESTRAAGTNQALRVEAGSRALLGSLGAEQCHHDAIELLSQTRRRPALARPEAYTNLSITRAARRHDA